MSIRKNVMSLLAISFLVSSCALLNQKQTDDDARIKGYASDKVKYDIRNGLDGKLSGFGIWQDKDGIVIKRFKVDVDASWEEDKGVIKYVFNYDDKSKDSRTLLVTVDNDHDYVAIGHDIVGTVVGRQYGGTSQARYSLTIKENNIKNNYKVDEWTYAVDDNSFMIVSDIGKEGNQKIIISLKKINEKKKED